MRLADVGEFGLLDRLGLLSAGSAGGPGDDTAVLPVGDGVLLFTADALVEGVHFRRDWGRPEDLGWKTLAVNASDVAAMGGTPWAFTLTLSAPPDLPVSWIEAFYRGLREAARAFGCFLAGGDTTAARDLTLSLALLGRTRSPILRSGARPGDDLYVSGFPGESAAGLALLQAGREARFPHLVRRHLRPEPRLALGAALAGSGAASALIDVSDGLLQDLGHLARASGAGAEVWAERVPVSADLGRAAEGLGADPRGWVFGGGEDYELLFSAPPGRRGAVETLARAAATPVWRIGRFTPEPGVRVLAHGAPWAPRRAGHDHFRSG
ncbi:MAG: thiamine-phosphate kinase [Candidatus Dadabacteria bacterium]|nr:MAG: thiamine-phosphate kinase [Candidatus Dadabacteria bacterium]